jgi:putative membrane-bound dehydrogenase-like protein
MSRLPAFVALCLLASPVSAQTPLPKVPDGFKVEIVLQAPDIEAPTALAVASNGDVYFAEDPMDMSGPPTKNLDRIWLLKGGDPTKKILFADKMWAVMGLEVVGDKLYCVHAPHVTVFTLDAEGKAKKREELFDDLGPPVAGVPSFNDHIPSGIHMGMDGWLYVSIGDKGIPKMTRKETDQGSVHVAEGRWRHSKEGHHISLEGGGVIRFRPDGSGLEVFASGTRNHLDVPMDEHDRIFVRDNTDDGDGWNTRFMYLPRGGFLGYPWAFKKHPNETLPMIHDFGGGSPCGGWVYLDDGLPETYRGRIFHCEWGKGKVFAVKVAPDGAGFKYVDVITFMDPTGTGVKDFRPFTLRPTADGRGFYVTDWGFSGWLQKIKAGRIYKVTYVKDDVKPKPRGKDTDSIEDLIKALDHPAHSERLRAQRAIERLLSTEKEWIKAGNAFVAMCKDGKASPAVKRHFLWALNSSCPKQDVKEWHDPRAWTGLEDDPIPFLLEDKDASVRAEAVRMEADRGFKLPRLNLKRRVFEDEDPSVRYQVAIYYLYRGELLGNWRLRTDVPYFLSETDVYVRHALIKAMKREARWDLFTGWMTETKRAESRELPLEAFAEAYDPRAVTALAEAMPRFSNPVLRSRAVEILARNYKDRKPYAGTWWGTRPEQQRPPARVVAWEGTPKVRDAVVAALADKDAGVRQAAVAALVEMKDPDTFEPLRTRFAQEKDEATRVDLVKAVAGLKTTASGEFVRSVAVNAELPQAVRLEALRGLDATTPAVDDALGQLVGGKEPTALQTAALEALARLKRPSAATVARKGLDNADAAVRRAAVVALATSGDAANGRFVQPSLDDKDAAVRLAAIQALGALKDRAAVSALLKVAAVETTQFDAITALAQVPDKRALTAYLTGLASKNADLRKSCGAAIAAIREEASPLLAELAKRNELPAAVLPELRTVYLSHAPIASWRLIGPFPGLDKANPPETELNFDAVYDAAGKKLKWRSDQRADLKNHGRVNLAALFSPTDDMVAYGYAEVRVEEARDAQLLIGSDDTITIWVNGTKVHQFDGNRGWKHDQDRATVKLVKGTNKILIKCGNKSGPWEFSVALSGDESKYAFLKGGAKKLDPESFRQFARKTAGDAERGRKLFGDLKGLACIKCHAIGGEGGKVGPDLAGIGLKYKREDLMTSILEPSKVIAQGYETIVVVTNKGVTITGVFKGETADAVNLMDAEGKAHSILKKDIDERNFSPLSTMPNGLSDGMTLQDFADLLAFLEARREEKTPMKKGA